MKTNIILKRFGIWLMLLFMPLIVTAAHSYVDLGLPSGTLWADCNVGASTSEGYGNFYAWGETKTKSTYSWSNYQYASGSSSSVQDIGTNIAGTKYDAAMAAWGGDWAMPTMEQANELVKICSISLATLNNVKGLRFKGPNGNTIFFPMTGYKYDSTYSAEGTQTYLWTDTKDIVTQMPEKAIAIYIERSSTKAKVKTTAAYRRSGMVIRAVRAKGEVTPSSADTDPQMVDLGLSVKWCSQNVNATNESEYGAFYAWGETVPKTSYTWANYQHANGSAATVWDIGGNIAGTEYDVAFKSKVYDPDAKKPIAVSLPTTAQYEELLSLCTWKEAMVEGHKGYRVTGPNGKSIFLPLAGCSYEGKEYCRDVSCNYWTSEVNASDAQRANVLYIKTATSPKMSVAQRRTGAAVRAVEWMEDSSHDTELVDLGLSVRWCNQNLGAETPGQRGDFYAWGETTPKNTYTWANYQHANGSATTVSNIGSNISGTEYDVAFKYKGYDSDTGNQMTVCLPTMAQYEELLTKCTWKETVVEGHKGYNVTGPSGKSIFFPLAGCSFDGNEYSQEISCNYWTSEVNASDASKANVLYIKTATTPKMSVAQRRTGAIVRPVEKVDVVTTAIPYVVLNGTTLTFYYDGMRDSRMGTAYDLNSGSSAPKWLPSASNVKTVVFDSSFKDARPNSCCQWFHGMSALATITGIAHLNTSEVTNMQEMFTYCSNLSSLDLSHFNTANVTDMSAMFFFCTNLESLDLNNFDTKKVEHMGLMFAFSGLKELDLSNFVIPDSTMSKGKATFNMLGACQSLTRLVVPATAVNMCKNSCELVGTNRQPCHITAPVGFNFGVNTSGDYFKWKGGCFRFTSSGGSANSQAFDTDGVRGVMTPIPVKNNDVIYTLQGVKVEGELKPGIYIRNGRKFIVR